MSLKRITKNPEPPKELIEFVEKQQKSVKKEDSKQQPIITQATPSEQQDDVVDNRPKILLISDDIRSPTGVGSMAHQIILGSKDRINWVQMACTRIHPEHGRIVEFEGIPLYCASGFGTQEMVEQILSKEKPDGVILFTDPRHFFTQWRMENYIRASIPMMYYTIWDNYPVPHYNLPYYESCDGLFCISRQSEDIVRKVLGDLANDKVIAYVPHGIDEDKFKPLELEEYESFFENINKDVYLEDFEFIFLWSNKNMIRKCAMDMLVAYNDACMEGHIDPETTCLILNTNRVQDEGTDLNVFIRDNLSPDLNIFFVENGSMSREDIVKLYNIADVTINNSNAEGFGLAVAESIMCGRPVIATVTGGLQDQMGFDETIFDDTPKGDRTRHFMGGRKLDHGSWAFPLYPEAPTFIGSPVTPYIYQDNVSSRQIQMEMTEAYRLGRVEMRKRGLEGREWMIKNGFTNANMVDGIVDGIKKTVENFKPKKVFEYIRLI